jgi:large subunit ribosomal protein L21
MLAVVEIAGQQFEVEKNSKYVVPLLQGEPGDSLEFDKIYMASDENGTQVGTPVLEGKVQAKIVEHGRGDKILVFHKKRRKGYRKLNGHKTKFTEIEITDININN